MLPIRKFMGDIPEIHSMKQPTLRPRGRHEFRAFGLAWRLAAGFLLISALASTLTPGLFAQTPAPATSPAPAPAPLSSNRFLFVVDISKPMEKEVPDVVRVVNEILRSSASGQLHNGDSIGVWTFNEDVYTGNLPLQIWSEDDAEEITLRIGEFLRQQDYGKKSRLDYAMGAIDKVIRGSDILTVFIISSGAGPIHGTPYDDSINAQYLQCLRDMGRKPKPLVTVLQGSRGRVIRYTVSAVPWPVVIPELPIPLKITEAPPAKPAPPPPPPGPSMILVGTNTTAYVPPPPVQPASAAPVTLVNPPPQSSVIQPPSAPGPQIPALPPPVPAVAPQTPPAVAVNTPPTPTPAPAPAPAAQPVPAPAVPPSVSEGPNPPLLPPPAQFHPPTTGQMPFVPPRQPPLVQKPFPASETMAQDTAPAEPAAVPPSAPAADATPVSRVAPNPAPAPAPVQPPPATLGAQATALIKSFTGTHRNLLLAVGACLLLAVGGLIFVLARGSRPSGRSSLITQTMNNRRQ
jgi:hypothetical protein